MYLKDKPRGLFNKYLTDAITKKISVMNMYEEILNGRLFYTMLMNILCRIRYCQAPFVYLIYC